MAKFNDIFSPQTLEKLNQKSSDSLQLMMGNKNLMQIMMSSRQLLNDIIEIESPYKTTLENLAVDIVKKTYPNIKQENIGVDAKIVSISDVGKSLDEATSGERRRRVVNAFTQGASSVSLEELLEIFENHIHEINSTLYEKYNQIMKDTFGVYDNDEAIALMLAAVTSNNKIAGGSSKIIIEAISIRARAVCFPMLVHEIIKGYYGILGQNALKGDKETIQSIIKNVDKLENEPEDIKYGKYIYKAINNIFLTFTDIKDKQVQSLFIMDIFDLDDNEFFSFIENAINENLTSEQIKWAKDNIEDDVDYVNQQRQEEKDIDNVDLSDLGLEEEKHAYIKGDDIDEYDVESSQDIKEFVQFMREYKQPLQEAEYQGRKVQLGKPMQGDVKKFKVYVKNPKGKVVKVNFGFGGTSAKGKRMVIKKNNPVRRKAFRARHNCDSPGPRTKARYWSCRKW